MTPSKHTPAGYRIKVRGSKYAHLLVEGPDDKRAFECLRDEIEQRAGNVDPGLTVVIDTTDMIEGDEVRGLERREVVEATCAGWRQENERNRLVGFVDRDFRGFDPETATDEFTSHRVLGAIVWSRGHSLENYFFDLRVARRVFRAVARREFKETFALYERIFPSALVIACSLSLAGREHGKLKAVQGSVSWEELRIQDGFLELDLHEWATRMKETLRFTDGMISELQQSYIRWHEVLKGHPEEFVRWACHGHIGMAVLWTAFARAAFDITQDKSVADDLYSTKRDIRFGGFVNQWAGMNLRDEVENPSIVFDQLDCRVD